MLGTQHLLARLGGGKLANRIGVRQVSVISKMSESREERYVTTNRSARQHLWYIFVCLANRHLSMHAAFGERVRHNQMLIMRIEAPTDWVSGKRR